MRRLKNKFKRPRRPWDATRIEEEKLILKTYGLRRKREIYRIRAELRKFRKRARDLIAIKDKDKEKVLIDKLHRLGILEKDKASLDDVLALRIDNLLERRLQTVVLKKGFAKTARMARQMIVHGHVRIGERTVKFPSYIVSTSDEQAMASDMKYIPKAPEAVPEASK